MWSDFKILPYMKDLFPVTTISLIVILSGWLKTTIVCVIIIKYQEKQIALLEKQLEKLN